MPGDEQYAKNLLAHGRELLGKRLITLGYLTELRGFYNGIDIFVNTSQEEACSISILESLACGCPVVGYPSVSVGEQILPSGGEIVAQDDRGQLTSAIVRWLQDDDRRIKARQGARQRAVEAFDIRKIADGLWDEYSSVLSERIDARKPLALRPS